MDKAFDVKALLEKAKQKGGESAEKNMKANWEAIKEWALESAALSDKAVLKAAIGLAIPVIDGLLKPVLDQIDGVAGN